MTTIVKLIDLHEDEISYKDTKINFFEYQCKSCDDTTIYSLEELIEHYKFDHKHDDDDD